MSRNTGLCGAIMTDEAVSLLEKFLSVPADCYLSKKKNPRSGKAIYCAMIDGVGTAEAMTVERTLELALTNYHLSAGK